MKTLEKITENYLTSEACDIVNNIAVNDSFITSDNVYEVREITNKIIKCTTPSMMFWRPERKVFTKDKLQDLFESGLAEII